jgi:hypothetical protein
MQQVGLAAAQHLQKPLKSITTNSGEKAAEKSSVTTSSGEERRRDEWQECLQKGS